MRKSFSFRKGARVSGLRNKFAKGRPKGRISRKERWY